MLRLFQRMLLTCLLLVLVWFGGFCWFVAQMPIHRTHAPEKADAIIVLTGGSGRIRLGIDLLLTQKADILFVSGANKQVSYDDVVSLAPKSSRDAVRKLSGNRIILGNNAENTIGNAQEVRRWLEDKPYQHILLVTSNYHMPRSMSEFAQEMPGKTFTPVAVIPKLDNHSFWWLNEQYRHIVLSEYYKFIISKLRHWAINEVFIHFPS